MTIEINGEEYTEIDSVNKEIAQSLGAEELDEGSLKERHTRALEEAQAKRSVRQQKEADRELYAHIRRHFGTTLKSVDSFFRLCSAKGYTAQDSAEILKLYKSIPKQAKKNVVERFLKI